LTPAERASRELPEHSIECGQGIAESSANPFLSSHPRPQRGV